MGAKSNSTTFLKKWTIFSEVDENIMKDIKYFHEFQTYTGHEKTRNDCILYLTTNDEMFAVGSNNEDNLLVLSGEDFAKNIVVTKPRKINELSGKNIKKFAVSERFGAAMTGDGKLLYWGTDMAALQHETRDLKYVKLPFEPKPNFKIIDMVCGAHSITVITGRNEVVIWGCINLYYSTFYDFEEVKIRKNTQIVAMACGWYHVAMLDQNGNVWTFGYGSVGQLGYRWSAAEHRYTTPQKVDLPQPCIKVECGAFSTLFLLNNGEVFACGSNSQSDLLCVDQIGYVLKPAKVLLNEYITNIAATYAWSFGRWQSVFAAFSHQSKKYFKWGNDPDLKGPAEINDVHSLVEMFSNFKTPQSLGELNKFEDLTLENKLGQGLKMNESFDQGVYLSVLHLWPLFDMLKKQFIENMKCFTVYSSIKGFKGQVAFGTFIVTKDDDVYSWGFNGNNKLLGLEGAISDAEEHENPQKVNVLSRKKIEKIFVNVRGGVALSENGTLYVWNGETSPAANEVNGKVVNLSCGLNFYLYLLENNDLYIKGRVSYDYPEEDTTKITMPNSESVVSLATGHWHCALLTENATVYTFGGNIYGQLGYESKSTVIPHQPKKVTLPGRCKKVECGVASTFFLLETGELYACGANSMSDNLGVGHTKTVYTPEKCLVDEPIEDIVVGRCTGVTSLFFSMFAIKSTTNKIYTWGKDVSRPTIASGLKDMVEAFEDQITPQSLSLIALKPEDNTDSINEGTESVLRNATEAAPTNLFGDPLYSDVTIKLKDGVLPAHRVILHTNSELFRAEMLKTDVTDRRELDFSSYNPISMKAYLKHLYGLPIGKRAGVTDLLDFHDLAKKDNNVEMLKTSLELLFTNMVFDLYSTENKLTENRFDENSKRMIDYIKSSQFP